MKTSRQAYLEASLKLQEVCKPLFRVTPINSVYCARFYSNRDFQVMISDQHDLHNYLENKLYLQEFELKRFEEFASGFVYAPAKLAAVAKEQTPMPNDFLSFYFKNKESVDLVKFNFAKDEVNKGEFDCKDFPFLQKYSLTLLPLVQALLKGVKKFNIPYAGVSIESNKAIKEKKLRILIKLLQANKSIKAVGETKTEITEREYECLRLLINKNTAKQAARVLGISHRTVEHHYDRIKFKLGLATKKQLLELFEYE